MAFTMAHTNINVFDLDASIDFYQKALGLSVKRVKENPGKFKIAFLQDDRSSCQLELTWYRNRKNPYNLGDNEIHIGFRTDNYEEALVHHRDMGCVCFENEKFGVYFIEDPDGYWMEIVPVR